MESITSEPTPVDEPVADSLPSMADLDQLSADLDAVDQTLQALDADGLEAVHAESGSAEPESAEPETVAPVGQVGSSDFAAR